MTQRLRRTAETGIGRAAHKRRALDPAGRGRTDDPAPIGDAALPRWAVYLILALFCTTCWTGAFLLVSLLF